MDLGALLFMVALSYGLGVLWYNLLPGNVPDKVWRVAAYPFIGIYASQTLLGPQMTFDPKMGGIQLLTAAIGSIVAVIVDWIISEVRKPSASAWPSRSAV